MRDFTADKQQRYSTICTSENILGMTILKATITFLFADTRIYLYLLKSYWLSKSVMVSHNWEKMIWWLFNGSHNKCQKAVCHILFRIDNTFTTFVLVVNAAFDAGLFQRQLIRKRDIARWHFLMVRHSIYFSHKNCFKTDMGPEYGMSIYMSLISWIIFCRCKLQVHFGTRF